MSAVERINAVLAQSFETAQDKRAALMAARAGEFKSLARPRSLSRGRYGIDILQADARQGEIEIFARVFRDGAQLGFGPDGTVDVERFVIVNPPVLVRDNDGEVVQTANGQQDRTIQRRFRVDIAECLLDVLADMIQRGAKSGNKIIPGKEGRTTYTIFSANDGYIASNNATYSTARAGSDLNNLSSDIYVGQDRYDSYDCYEGFVSFDTSSVLGTVSSATLSLYGGVDGSTAADFTVNARLKSYSTLDASDWVAGASLSALTLLATFNTTGFSTSGYNVFTSQAAFLSNINQSGVTGIILSSSRHEAGTAVAANNTDEYVRMHASVASGTTQDPRLVVDASTGPSLAVVMHHLAQQGIS